MIRRGKGREGGRREGGWVCVCFSRDEEEVVCRLAFMMRRGKVGREGKREGVSVLEEKEGRLFSFIFFS